jgi:hypothetical protein
MALCGGLPLLMVDSMREHSSKKWSLAFRKTLRSVLGSVYQLWHNRLETKSELSVYRRNGPEEVARESARSTPDLRAPMSRGPREYNLLGRRLETLGIDPNELAQSDPLLLGELQKLCARCKSHGACALELEHASADAAWGEWREYCPNAVKLNELRIRSIPRHDPTVLKWLNRRQ